MMHGGHNMQQKSRLAQVIRAGSAIALVVALGAAQQAQAGSFDDFFTRIIRDDAGGIAALVQRGFDPNTMNDKGETGLTQAFKLDSYRAVKGLISLPATNVNLANAKGETPLMMAAIKGQLDLAKELIARGADVNRPGWTPLHYAVSKASEDDSDLKMIALLVEHHAYIDAASPNGTTPLMMAAQYGSRSAVQKLLQEGADPKLKNQAGQTATDFAERAERPEVVTWLAQAGGTTGGPNVAAGQPAGKTAAQPSNASGNLPNMTGPAFQQEGRKKIRSNW